MKASLFIVAVSGVWLHAQVPKFDVVSIKTCKQGEMVPGGSSPGRLHVGCGILANTDNTGLIQVAYHRYAGGRLSAYGVIPIEGGPDWIHSATFEIDGTAEGQPSFQMMEGPMMQRILEERFKLKIHRETRQGPVYELALGKSSPKLTPMQDGKCIPVSVGRALPPLSGEQRYCRNMVSPRSVNFEGGTLSMLAELLNLVVDRPVIDKTGLADYFQIQLKFSTDEMAGRGPAPVTPGAVEIKTQDAPNIFQAVQEQLGLRLVPGKGPVEVLVIDHIERPTEN